MTHGNPPNRTHGTNSPNQNPPNPTQDAAIYMLDTKSPLADGEYRATYLTGGVQVVNERCVALVMLFKLEDEREEWFGMCFLAPDTASDEDATEGCLHLCVDAAAHIAAAFGVRVPEGNMDMLSFQGRKVSLFVNDDSIVGFTSDTGSFHCDDFFSGGRLPA